MLANIEVWAFATLIVSLWVLAFGVRRHVKVPSFDVIDETPARPAPRLEPAVPVLAVPKPPKASAPVMQRLSVRDELARLQSVLDRSAGHADDITHHQAAAATQLAAAETSLQRLLDEVHRLEADRFIPQTTPANASIVPLPKPRVVVAA